MTVLHRFRVGLYALVCLATLCQWLGEDEAALPYPWLLILWAVATYAFTDVWEKLVIPARLAPWLGLVVVAIFVQEEVRSFTADPVQPLGHLMVYFQVLLFVHVKKPGHRRHWFMLLVSFLQMMIAAPHNHKPLFGALLVVYLALLVWTMNRFLVLRESQRFGSFQAFPFSDPHSLPVDAPSATPVGEFRTPAPADTPWFRQVTGTLGASGLVLLGAMVLFVLIPRRGQTAWRQPTGGVTSRVVGFDEQVRLGQLGTILDSGDEVMTVQLFDENGQPLRLAEEPLWRGVALQYYQNGRWERQPAVFIHPAPWKVDSARVIRQEIRLQPVHPEILFGLRPAHRGYTRDGRALVLGQIDGTLLRPDESSSAALNYTLESGRELDDQPKEIEGWRVAYRKEFREVWLQLPDELRDPLVEYVSRLVKPDTTDQEEIFRRLITHLQDPRLFRYTLDEKAVDRSIDPVLDFLLNRHAGHCEYFASALALMLRARGLPARVVNGFKGGDWNELIGKSWVVRQRHAHSWVEAMLVKNENFAHWVPLDPTPGDARQMFVARQSIIPAPVRQLLDASRHVWSNYVLNFNGPEQEAAVYGPVRELAAAVPRMFAVAAEKLWLMPGGRVLVSALLIAIGALACRVPIRWLVAWLSGAGPVVAKRAQGADAGLLARLANWLRTLLQRGTPGKPASHRRIAFYEQLLQALEAHGLHKLAGWTPQQFAEQAGTALRQSSGTESISVIPAELIDYFYRVRFGCHDLDPRESSEIEFKLRSLRQAIAQRDRRKAPVGTRGASAP